MAVDPGFETERVLTFSLLKMGEPPERLRFYDHLENELGALPGVTAVGAVSSLPLTGPGGRAQAHVEGHSWGSRKAPEMRFRSVTPGYFGVMGLSLVRGRLHVLRDRDNDALPLVLNQEAAARIFEGRDPIGRRIRLGPDSTAAYRTVIGIVENARNESLTEGAQPEVFLLHAQIASGGMSVALRTEVQPLSLVPQLRSIVARLDPTIVVDDIRTTRQLVDESVSKPRFVMVLLTGFAGLGLLLAIVGTYGVLAYSVAQRQREIGIRMALGADRRSVLHLIVGEGGRLAALGIAIGLGAALLATRLLQGMLFQVSSADPLAFGGTIIVIAATTLLATCIPALRAAQLNPGVIMRGE